MNQYRATFSDGTHRDVAALDLHRAVVELLADAHPVDSIMQVRNVDFIPATELEREPAAPLATE